MDRTPCFNYHDRCAYCHVECPKYISFRAERDKLLALRCEENKITEAIIDTVKRCKSHKGHNMTRSLQRGKTRCAT